MDYFKSLVGGAPSQAPVVADDAGNQFLEPSTTEMLTCTQISRTLQRPQPRRLSLSQRLLPMRKPFPGIPLASGANEPTPVDASSDAVGGVVGVKPAKATG